jgi:hypothetical protein
MFLTSPFIDQAISQACAVCSPFLGVNEWSREEAQ